MQKRIRAVAAAVAVTGSVLLATSAMALPSISMIWRDPGSGVPGFGATIGTPSVSASSIVVADIVIHSDSNFTIGIFISLEFDTSELFALGAVELVSVNLPGMGNSFTPFTLGTAAPDNVNGIIEGFEQKTLSTGLGVPSVTMTLGSVRFHVLNGPAYGQLGEEDVIVSLQGAVDTIGFSTGPGGANFVGADVVPEPTTAILLISGIVGLVYAGRKGLD